MADGQAGVWIQFREPVPDEGWPQLDACEIDGSQNPATGLDFQVEFESQTVVALSPRWGDASCLGLGS